MSGIFKEGELYYIFALVPYSRSSADGQLVPWHLVIFNKWYNTHRLFNAKFETRLLYFRKEGYIGLSCELFDKSFLWRTPWLKEKFKEETLKDYEWVDLKKTNEWDIFETNFRMNKGKSRVLNKVVVSGYRSSYSIWWFPKWLKNLYKKQYTEIHIKLSHGIGKNETFNLRYPYRKNLITSWVLFEQSELPKYLRGEK